MIANGGNTCADSVQTCPCCGGSGIISSGVTVVVHGGSSGDSDYVDTSYSPFGGAIHKVRNLKERFDKLMESWEKLEVPAVPKINFKVNIAPLRIIDFRSQIPMAKIRSKTMFPKSGYLPKRIRARKT